LAIGISQLNPKLQSTSAKNQNQNQIVVSLNW